jgi:hypothetical protein
MMLNAKSTKGESPRDEEITKGDEECKVFQGVERYPIKGDEESNDVQTLNTINHLGISAICSQKIVGIFVNQPAEASTKLKERIVRRPGKIEWGAQTCTYSDRLFRFPWLHSLSVPSAQFLNIAQTRY